MIAVFQFAQGRSLPVSDYASLMGYKYNNMDLLYSVIKWAIVAFIPLILCVVTFGYVATSQVNKKLNLSNFNRVAGGASTLGWLIVLPYLVIWMYVGNTKLAEEREKQVERKRELNWKLQEVRLEYNQSFIKDLNNR